MNRLSQYNLAGNFLHVGGGEYVPMRNIRSVEMLNDDDRAAMRERYPKARNDFQFRLQFWDKSQRLTVGLDAAPGTFVQVDSNVLVPLANVQGLKPLSADDQTKLKERYPNAERAFCTRIEGAGDGQSFLSTWTIAQITGIEEQALTSAQVEHQPPSGRSGFFRKNPEPAPAG